MRNEKAKQDSGGTRSLNVEMEDICDWPTDMMISVQPDCDSWRVAVMQEGSVDGADRREMVEQIAARLKGGDLAVCSHVAMPAVAK
jgi:hypothetical protein